MTPGMDPNQLPNHGTRTKEEEEEEEAEETTEDIQQDHKLHPKSEVSMHEEVSPSATQTTFYCKVTR